MQMKALSLLVYAASIPQPCYVDVQADLVINLYSHHHHMLCLLLRYTIENNTALTNFCTRNIIPHAISNIGQSQKSHLFASGIKHRSQE